MRLGKCILLGFGVVVGILAMLLGIILLPRILEGQGKCFETNNISDYGKITGNYDNDTPQRFIQSFFPKEIEAGFSNVTYHYKAKKLDSYAYEAYLEFEITDKEAFDTFIAETVEMDDCTAFVSDPSYCEYVIEDELLIFWDRDGKINPPIQYAKIGKVLFSEETHTIIFFAMGVYDGGGTSTDELNYFFNRFDIDPVEYAIALDASK